MSTVYHAKLKTRTGHVIEVEGSLKMKEIRAWGLAESLVDFPTCYTYLARVIKAWDFEGLDPRDVNSYDELDYRDYRAINDAVSRWLRQEDEAKN